MSDYEPWQLDGEASELYERYLVPSITSIWAADLVERAGPAAEERVLDIACGTGAVTRLVADRISTGRVVGLDYNPEMLAVARSVCPSAACGLRIDQAWQHIVGGRGTAQLLGARSCE